MGNETSWECQDGKFTNLTETDPSKYTYKEIELKGRFIDDVTFYSDGTEIKAIEI